MNYGVYETNGRYTPAMVHAAVKRGMKWMDERCPGWVREIDLDDFDMASGECCILGQTAVCLLDDADNPMDYDYDSVVSHEVGSVYSSEAAMWAGYYGFNIRFPGNGEAGAGDTYSRSESDTRFEMLQIGWVTAICERLESGG